ncbi:MAG: hypothetical protein JW874_12100 [Spirochaetales bacterium]|nr:hypothetical protein [Spirochaetales bacterium]
MKKTAVFIMLVLCVFPAEAQNPWNNSIILINSSGKKIVRVVVENRVSRETAADNTVSLDPGLSLEINIEGIGDLGLNIAGYAEDGSVFSAFNIDPSLDGFVVLEPEPTYYSAAPSAATQFNDLIQELNNTTWIQLRMENDGWTPDPDSYISFSFIENSILELQGTVLKKPLLVNDAVYLKEEKIIVLYTESLPDPEGNIELLDIYMNFSNLPEGIAAFQFGEGESFIFAPYHLLMDNLKKAEENALNQ